MIENGILNIYKPAGMTSHDVVNIVRRVMGIRRVGHTGTLDPMATGVLPVCVGAAARITEYLDMDFKTYRCTLQLGKTTDTQDIWGQIIEERPAEQVTEEAVRKAFAHFSGLIDQKPPMYSAVRVNGRRLYEYAREGKEIEVKTRKVFIRRLEILSFDKEAETVSFEVECSKGTYIRTICQDVGIWDWLINISLADKITKTPSDFDPNSECNSCQCIKKLTVIMHGTPNEYVSGVSAQWGDTHLFEGDKFTEISDMFKNIKFCSLCELELRSCHLGEYPFLKQRLENNTKCKVTVYQGGVNAFFPRLK